MDTEQQIKPIPPLVVGDGKLKKRFEINGWVKSLKNWFIGIKINF